MLCIFSYLLLGGVLKKIVKLIVTILTFNLFFASGFQINEHGARTMSLAGAFVGLANKPSAVYLNPAGIIQLKGTHLSLGTTYISPMTEFIGPDGNFSTTSELKKRFFTPINFYLTHQLTDRLTFGFAINNPFGLGTEWDDNWVGRYSAVKTEVRTFNFTPVIAYKFSEKFSASVGISISYADVLIGRKLQGLLPNPIQDPQHPFLIFPDAAIEMKGDDLSYGFIAGILFKATDNFSIGASFKSSIKYTMEGEAKLEFDPQTDQVAKQVGSLAFPSGNIEAPLTVPYVFTIGIAYKANENFTVTSDFQYNGWSTYDKLAITFKNWKNPKTGTNQMVSVRDYENSYILRFGAEYLVSKNTALRGGIFYDKNPVKDERLDATLPDADRIGLNFGFGYKLSENLSLDVSYLYLMFAERRINNSQEVIPIMPTPVFLNGLYKSKAHLIGVNLNYNF